MMFTLMFSVCGSSDEMLGRLGSRWFGEIPQALVPEHWKRLRQELPLDPGLVHEELPPPWEPQFSSGRTFASVSLHRRGGRGSTTVFSERQWKTLIKEVSHRPLLAGLGICELDEEGAPILDGELEFGMYTPDREPDVMTFTLTREESEEEDAERPTIFPDALFPCAVELLRELCRVEDVDFAGAGDSAYRRHRTMLDRTLDREEESARHAREWLRGYGWVTVVPRELVARLGGAAGPRESGAFVEVEELPHGGVWLRATECEADYGPDDMRRVFHALAPVLPPGMPRVEPQDPHGWQVVPEDAVNHR